MTAGSFEDHGCNDVVPEDLTRLCAPYQGGPRPPLELQAEYRSSCGSHGHAAMAHPGAPAGARAAAE